MLKSSVRADLAELKLNYSQNSDLTSAGQKIYENYENKLNAYNANLNSNSSDLNNKGLTDHQFRAINIIINSSSDFRSFESYEIYLDSKFRDYLDDNRLSKEDKFVILSFIVNYVESLRFVNDVQVKSNISNISLAGKGSLRENMTASWWDDWGKCAASIAGGAVTGATTLGLAGAAVGTVAMPVVGTVSAGAVGAIAGGVGGALTGAAAGC
ncbi:hypothetical protein [Sphingobacterium chungjuense]|uniref:hypothetical protein n=1 Tax=Sphingobacterium chungjuense TaxID=2675553 RepID=UPI0019D0EC6F|nr:hypothetical protein [Sphingobacterium chungjuense]